ncbi:MAG: hypothetical protein DCF27_09795 [Lysobacteraceae bacterium]|nr:MAG: hypothetical protein DCF27_09795 [Xanthomonadaceae bacterium]
MKSKLLAQVFLAFVLAFLALGIEYWPIPYSKASLPNSLYGAGLAFVFAVAVALRFFSKATFFQTLGAIGLAAPAMVMARVAVETSRDPTSHNLWPLEIIIAMGVGFSVAFAGALLGGLLTRLFKPSAAPGIDG